MIDFEQTQDGEIAQSFLDDPLFRKAMDAARHDIMDAWEATPARDVDAREFLWKLQQASLRFEGILKGYVDTGKVAKANLKENNTIARKVRSIF